MLRALVLVLSLAASAKEDLLVTVCKKACIFPHDAAVIACKATKKGWWATKTCIWDADRKQRSCERSCVKR